MSEDIMLWCVLILPEKLRIGNKEHFPT